MFTEDARVLPAEIAFQALVSKMLPRTRPYVLTTLRTRKVSLPSVHKTLISNFQPIPFFKSPTEIETFNADILSLRFHSECDVNFDIFKPFNNELFSSTSKQTSLFWPFRPTQLNTEFHLWMWYLLAVIPSNKHSVLFNSFRTQECTMSHKTCHSIERVECFFPHWLVLTQVHNIYCLYSCWLFVLQLHRSFSQAIFLSFIDTSVVFVLKNCLP